MCFFFFFLPISFRNYSNLDAHSPKYFDVKYLVFPRFSEYFSVIPYFEDLVFKIISTGFWLLMLLKDFFLPYSALYFLTIISFWVITVIKFVVSCSCNLLFLRMTLVLGLNCSFMAISFVLSMFRTSYSSCGWMG